MNVTLRLTYVTKKGAHVMRTVCPNNLETEIRKLYRRGIYTEAHEYNNGIRGVCVGGVYDHPGTRKRSWWCERWDK